MSTLKRLLYVRHAGSLIARADEIVETWQKQLPNGVDDPILTTQRELDARFLGILRSLCARQRQFVWASSAIIKEGADRRRVPEVFFRLSSEIFGSDHGSIETRYVNAVFALALTVEETLRSFLFLEFVLLCDLLAAVADARFAMDLPPSHLIRAFGGRASAISMIHQEEVLATAMPFDEILRNDPSGNYPLDNTPTKNDCRLAVSEIATATNRSLNDVASAVVGLCREHESNPVGNLGCIDFWLLGPGISELVARLGGAKRHLRLRKAPLTAGKFAAFALAITVCIVAILAALDAQYMQSPIFLLIASILCLDGGCRIAATLLDPLYPRRIPPALAYSAMSPVDRKSLLAIPTMLSSKEQLLTVLTNLENNYKNIADKQTAIALVIDYEDSDIAEPEKKDLNLIQLICSEINRLNEKYNSPPGAGLCAMLREKIYVKSEEKWMGLERKRGKILSIIEQIACMSSNLAMIAGDHRCLIGVRYLLVIDEDNLIMPGFVECLVGAMAHPLNGSRESTNSRCHVLGVPRIQQRSAFAVVPDFRPSNPEFNMFSQVPFTGKGIYDINAYTKSLANRIPDGIVLSHDTVEGFWTTPMFVSAALVLEGFPSNYLRLLERQHRWVRGNWQNLVAGLTGLIRQLPAYAWMTLGSQIRASIIPIARAAMVILLAISGREVTVLVGLFLLAFEEFVEACAFLFWTTLLGTDKSSMRRLPMRIGSACLGLLFKLSLSATEAIVNLDAIVKGIYRSIVRRKALEWVSSSTIEKRGISKLISGRAFYMSLAAGVAFSFGLAYQMKYPSAVAVLSLWTLAPLWVVSIKSEA